MNVGVKRHDLGVFTSLRQLKKTGVENMMGLFMVDSWAGKVGRLRVH